MQIPTYLSKDSRSFAKEPEKKCRHLAAWNVGFDKVAIVGFCRWK